MSDPKILIVDFEEKSLDFLLDCLKDEKCRTVTATDGESGLEKFESEKPDLVIMEAMLPKFHGFDLCKKITDNGEKKVPVIITTGFYRGEYYKIEALKSFGASAFIEKPFKKQELLYAVHNLLKNGGDVVVQKEEKPPLEIALPKDPQQESQKAERIDVSRKVDEMLEDTLTEFGLGKKKQEITTASEEKKTLIFPENTKKTVIGELEKENSKQTRQTVDKKAGKLDVETIKQEITKDQDTKKPEEKKDKKIGQKSQQNVAETKAEKPEREKKEFLPKKAPLEIKKPRDSELKSSVQEGMIEGSDTKKGKKPLRIQRIKFPALIGISYLKKVPEAIKVPRLRIVAPAVIASLAILASGYYLLKPTKAVSSPKEKGRLMISQSQQKMILTPIVDPLTPDLMSKSTSEGKAPDTVDAIQERSVEKASEEISSAGSMDVSGSEEIQENQNKGEEDTIQVQAEKNSPASELEITEYSPQIEDLNLLETPSLQDEEAPEFQVSETLTGESSVPDQQSPSEDVSSLSKDGPDNNPPPVINSPTEEVKRGDLIPIHLVDTQPVAIKKVNPRYPAKALTNIKEETVLLKALISETGDVLETQILRASETFGDFDTASEEAIKQWKFKPATKDGVKVRVWKVVSFKFTQK